MNEDKWDIDIEKWDRLGAARFEPDADALAEGTIRIEDLDFEDSEERQRRLREEEEELKISRQMEGQPSAYDPNENYAEEF